MIMNIKLTDVCDILYGYPFDSSKFNSNNGIGVVRIRDIVRGYTETFTTEDCSEQYAVKKGDILVGMDGEFNIAKWQGAPAMLNQRVCKLSPKANLDKNYLFYYMPIILKSIEARTPFVTVKHLSAKELNNVYLRLPSIEEQRKIALVLSTLDLLIENYYTQLQDLGNLVKSRFIEMFIQNDAVFPKKKLGQCTIINPKKSMDNRLKDDLIVSFVPMASVGEDGSINTSDTKSYCEVKNGFTYFIDGDVLFAKITPCMENGKGAVATNLCNGIGFGSTEFHVIRPLKGITNPVWLYTLSVLKEFRLAAEANMTGSAGQKRTPSSFLQNYEIKLPPIDLQDQFADFVAQVDKSKLAVQQSLNELETLKKSLMQQYFG